MASPIRANDLATRPHARSSRNAPSHREAVAADAHALVHEIIGSTVTPTGTIAREAGSASQQITGLGAQPSMPLTQASVSSLLPPSRTNVPTRGTPLVASRGKG